MVRHGVKLFNPCQILHLWHNHASDLRKNQNSTQLGLSLWGSSKVFPCPPQLLISPGTQDDNANVIFGQCDHRNGWGRTILLEEELAKELAVSKYSRKDETLEHEL